MCALSNSNRSLGFGNIDIPKIMNPSLKREIHQKARLLKVNVNRTTGGSGTLKLNVQGNQRQAREFQSWLSGRVKEIDPNARVLKPRVTFGENQSTGKMIAKGFNAPQPIQPAQPGGNTPNTNLPTPSPNLPNAAPGITNQNFGRMVAPTMPAPGSFGVPKPASGETTSNSVAESSNDVAPKVDNSDGAGSAGDMEI